MRRPEDVDRTYDLYAKPQAFERVPYVLAAAVNSVVSQQADGSSAEQMRAIRLQTVIDNSIVDRLVEGRVLRADVRRQRQGRAGKPLAEIGSAEAKACSRN